MDKEKIKQYAEIKNEIKALEEKAKELNDEIFNSMVENNLEEVNFDEGKLSLTPRKTWAYPASIVEADAKLKTMKKEAEQVGTATYTTAYSLRYTAKGEKE